MATSSEKSFYDMQRDQYYSAQEYRNMMMQEQMQNMYSNAQLQNAMSSRATPTLAVACEGTKSNLLLLIED